MPAQCSNDSANPVHGHFTYKRSDFIHIHNTQVQYTINSFASLLKLQVNVIKLSRIGIRVGPENLWVWVLLHDYLGGSRFEVAGDGGGRTGGFDTTVGPSRFRLLLPLNTCQRGDSSAPSRLVVRTGFRQCDHQRRMEGEGPPFTITGSIKPDLAFL